MNPAQTGAHPSPEEVDATLDLAGAAPEVVEHVSGCPRCSGLRDGLVEVRALLRQESQRVPEPPPDLGERIAAALGAAPDTRPTGDAGDSTRRRRPAAAWLALAAGLAVVAGGAAVAVQAASSNGADVASSLEESSEAQVDEGAGDSAAAGSGAAESRAADSGAGDSGEGAARPELMEAGGTAVDTGTDYRPEDLSAQVTALLAPASAARSAPPGLVPAPEAEDSAEEPAEDSAADRSLADPAAQRECLAAIGAPAEVPLAVDLARWQGQDAAVLVLPEPASEGVAAASGRLEVWVVPRACGPADPAILHFARVEP